MNNEEQVKYYIKILVLHKWGLNKKLSPHVLMKDLSYTIKRNDSDLFEWFKQEHKQLGRRNFRIKYFDGTGGTSELTGDRTAECECRGGSHKWRSMI